MLRLHLNLQHFWQRTNVLRAMEHMYFVFIVVVVDTDKYVHSIKASCVGHIPWQFLFTFHISLKQNKIS